MLYVWDSVNDIVTAIEIIWFNYKHDEEWIVCICKCSTLKTHNYQTINYNVDKAYLEMKLNIWKIKNKLTY